jgi:hypothetical protein
VFVYFFNIYLSKRVSDITKIVMVIRVKNGCWHVHMSSSGSFCDTACENILFRQYGEVWSGLKWSQHYVNWKGYLTLNEACALLWIISWEGNDGRYGVVWRNWRNSAEYVNFSKRGLCCFVCCIHLLQTPNNCNNVALNRDKHYSSLYFVKYPPYREMFHMIVIDLNVSLSHTRGNSFFGNI